MTAYLKAHYPLEFMAALLSGDIDGRNFKKKDSLVEHLDDCRRMSLTVMPPDVNASYADFTVCDGKIVFALAAIKGCGGSAGEAIAAARNVDGPFRSLFDFCQRCEIERITRFLKPAQPEGRQRLGVSKCLLPAEFGIGIDSEHCSRRQD